MTPTCCYAIYEASACRASMGRMLLGRNSFVAFRGKPTGSLVAMKIDFSLARSPCTWNWVSMLVCSVPEHVSRLFQIYSFLCFGLVFGVTPPKKTTDKNQVHFVTWVTCDKRFGWQIFDLLVLCVVTRSLCTLMTPNFAWTRHWRNKVCSTSAWYHGPGSLKYNMPGKSFYGDLNRTCEMKWLVLK